MRFPICKVCLKNKILCKACEKVVKENKIDGEEIKMYRQINRILKPYNFAEDIEIKRAISNENVLLIITNKNDVSKIIGKQGGIVRKLGKELNRQIRVMAEPSSPKEFIKEIFFSIPIMGINTVYTPNSTTYKIRIPGSERNNMSISPEKFSNIFNSFFNENVDIIFE